MPHVPSRRQIPTLAVALLALLMSLTGTATAAKALITSRDIKNGTIKLVDLSKKTRKQLTAHSRRAAVADAVNDLDTGKRVSLSSTPSGGSLLPLSEDGSFPEAVLPLNSTTKAPNVAARIYSSSDQAIPIQIAGGPVKLLTFDRVSFDTAHLFDPTHPTRLRAPVTGIYLINANISWQVSSTSGRNRAVYVYVNGHAVSVDQRPPAEETRQVVTTLYGLNAGDEVEVGVGHDEAPSLNANAVGDYAPSLAIAWIAPG
ncbi:MAG TPA: hypothetical protein VFM83_08405 [Gaiellaceae bacterium]|nr:hypothetical protein [Gaiellaceae bacterium]